MDLNVPLRTIGMIRCSHRDLETTPIQAGVNRAEQAVIDLEPAFADGLDGLGGFDYAWLLTWLHQQSSVDVPPLRQVPFLLRGQRRLMGIFATRAPRRVNPIGLSLIQIIDVAGTSVTFAGVEMVDGTPVIDIKPYVTRFDRPAGDPRCGWFDQVSIDERATPARLATWS
ncbi:MAG: tRNA (N6-threonylcarbamoyladenosine(37)-N6)-methyltransferase TrmO [Streptosporangiaceae bacterium]